MLERIIEFIPFFALAIISAYMSYLLDKKYDYVTRINRRLNLNGITSIVLYIGTMSLIMFFVPYVVIVKLLASKYIAYVIVSLIIGICCYSAMDYKNTIS